MSIEQFSYVLNYLSTFIMLYFFMLLLLRWQLWMLPGLCSVANLRKHFCKFSIFSTHKTFAKRFVTEQSSLELGFPIRVYSSVKITKCCLLCLFFRCVLSYLGSDGCCSRHVCILGYLHLIIQTVFMVWYKSHVSKNVLGPFFAEKL